MRFVSCICAILLMGATVAAADQASTPRKVVINSEPFPPLSTVEGTGFEDLLAKEMYRRLGIEIDINMVPSERGLVNANAGIDDGTLSRVGGMSSKYRNLLQIEEIAVERDYVAFARRSDIRIDGWSSLKPYDVGIVNGWKILERNIKDVRSLTKVRQPMQLFQLLELGRVDVIVFARYSGLQMIHDLGLKGVEVLEPPLASRATYFYLHKNHQGLVPRAAAALREMKADGTYRRLYDRIIGPLASGSE
jgi:polar amino acid transport system substrate-binding protein